MPRLWFAAALLVCLIPPARALDPNRAITQYIRDRWSGERGFPGGNVNAITEADGFLWIGAQKGLVRFDGVNFRLFNHTDYSGLPNGPVLGLITDSEGNLWVRLESPGLVRLRHGIFEDVLPDLTPALGVTAMARGLHGDVLLARPGAPSRYRGGKLEPIGRRAGNMSGLALSIAETADGAVWMGTRDAGLFFLRDGQAFAPVGLPDRKVNCVLPGDGPRLWVGTDVGLIRWNGRELTREGVPPSLRTVQILAMTRDHESNVWVGTGSGLVRIDAHGVASVARRPGSAVGPVTTLFEDREGNLWVGGTQGIERYRDSVFLTYSPAADLALRDSGDDGGPLYIDPSGRTWFGPPSGGLVWLKETERGRLEIAGVGRDVVYSIDGGAGELWLGRQRGGVTHLRGQAGGWSDRTYTSADGLAPGSVYVVHRNRDGTLWAGTLGGGVSSIRNGRVTTYTSPNGPASNTIWAIEEGANGTMWFATPNGLSAFEHDRWRVYTSQQGLPPGRINCLTSDASGVLWIGTSAGLVFLRNGQVKTPRSLPEPLLEEVLGIAVDGRGSVWIAGASHILRASRARLLGESSDPGDLREFGAADGLPATEGARRQRSVTTDRLGRVWFALHRGIAVVDPSRLVNESVPAIVHVETVSADGRALAVTSPLRIPAGRQRLTFRYVGLSLSVPERVRFRYRLDGFDHDWSEPSATPETGYTNLSPGPYRFRVIASNSEGLWNSAESVIDLDVAPAAWQTLWFRLLAVGICTLGILAVYRLRLHQLATRLNLRFEERLAERTSIARDLHDTLLQGLLSASMQLHVAATSVPDNLPAKSQLTRVQQLMHHVVDEGRNAVRGLRFSGTAFDDLETAFSKLRDEQLLSEDAEFRVIVEGRSRALNPLIRDEVYRIGREALVNAFRHSEAASVEVELDYAPHRFRLVVRDNGRGIDAEVLRSGREGHWGLIGMRERAERIGARLKVWSRAAAGTEVELTVEGEIAFPNQRAGSRWKWLPPRWPGRDRMELRLPSRKQDQ